MSSITSRHGPLLIITIWPNLYRRLAEYFEKLEFFKCVIFSIEIETKIEIEV
jgi:hypothetical protein